MSKNYDFKVGDEVAIFNGYSAHIDYTYSKDVIERDTPTTWVLRSGRKVNKNTLRMVPSSDGSMKPLQEYFDHHGTRLEKHREHYAKVFKREMSHIERNIFETVKEIEERGKTDPSILELLKVNNKAIWKDVKGHNFPLIFNAYILVNGLVAFARVVSACMKKGVFFDIQCPVTGKVTKSNVQAEKYCLVEDFLKHNEVPCTK